MSKLQGCAAQNKVWEEWEDDVIRNNYGKLTYAGICNLLPGRTNQSVQHRRRKLGLESINKSSIAVEKWSDEDEKFLIKNYGVVPYSSLVKYLGRSAGSIAGKIRRLIKEDRLSYTVGPKEVWVKEEDDIIRNLYETHTLKELTVLLPNRSKKSLIHRKKILGLDFDKRELNRTYSVNMDFFSEPNVLNSYWAGFIAADGCLTKKKHLFSIGLQARDGYHLEQLVKDVGYSGTVRYFTDNEGYDKAVVFIWGVKQWFLDLEKHFSIVPKKSLVLLPPKIITEECIKSYLRGFIDGDGSVIFDSNPTKCFIRVCGTKGMMEWVKFWFERWVPPEESNYKTSEVRGPYKTKIFYYSIHSRRALKIFEQLLSVDTPFLKRKMGTCF
jgi:hypothetical protein